MRLLLPVGPSIHRRRTAGCAASLVLHAVLFALLTVRSSVSPEGSSDVEARGQIAIVAVPEDVLLPIEPLADDQDDPRLEPDPALTMDGFRFDVQKIRRRQRALFPFLTGDVLFLEPLVERTRVDPSKVYNPLGQRSPSRGEPLMLDPSALQRAIDASWSRRDRWTKFTEIATLLESHDPHLGQAAELVHAYLDQNLLQPYEDARTRDSKYWVMMELVSDHSDFIDFIRSFSRRHPSSRTTTELLFLLDELAQGSLDSLLMLLQTAPAIDLTATLLSDRHAFELAAHIDTYYRRWLAAHNLSSPEAVVQHYGGLRLRILNAILDATPSGYRAGDARFLIGQLLFDRNDVEGAFRVWRGIRIDLTDNYVAAYSQILRAIDTPGRTAVPEVIGILAGERLRWLEFSRERLRAFGYGFNTF